MEYMDTNIKELCYNACFKVIIWNMKTVICLIVLSYAFPDLQRFKHTSSCYFQAEQRTFVHVKIKAAVTLEILTYEALTSCSDHLCLQLANTRNNFPPCPGWRGLIMDGYELLSTSPPCDFIGYALTA